MAKRVFLIVMDSMGIGALPDAHEYGDTGSNTFASVYNTGKLHIPHLQALGIFNIDGVDYGEKAEQPVGSFCRLAQQSKGKDTSVGHWEIAGAISQKPLPVFPDGFPPKIIQQLEQQTLKKVLCNKPYSGIQVLRDYGREQVRTGNIIVYTSADSVMQIAAHETIIPLRDLYSICETARSIMKDEYAVGRIIARPFIGNPPDFERSVNRRDFSLPSPSKTMLDVLSAKWLDVIGVGKIFDIFAGRGVTKSYNTHGNKKCMEQTLSLVGDSFTGLCFVNLVDFDSSFGHRNNPIGYANSLNEFDVQLGDLYQRMRPHDIVIITADHGCDPLTPSTDHSREYVPMIAFGDLIKNGVNLGTRATFADISATIQEFLELEVKTSGQSFLSEIHV